jgi:hypothetical protein
MSDYTTVGYSLLLSRDKLVKVEQDRWAGGGLLGAMVANVQGGAGCWRHHEAGGRADHCQGWGGLLNRLYAVSACLSYATRGSGAAHSIDWGVRVVTGADWLPAFLCSLRAPPQGDCARRQVLRLHRHCGLCGSAGAGPLLLRGLGWAGLGRSGPVRAGPRLHDVQRLLGECAGAALRCRLPGNPGSRRPCPAPSCTWRHHCNPCPRPHPCPPGRAAQRHRARQPAPHARAARRARAQRRGCRAAHQHDVRHDPGGRPC